MLKKSDSLQAARITAEAREMSHCVARILDNKQIQYKIQTVDLTHFDSIWYQVDIRTRPESGLTVVLHLFRNAIGLFCNDHEIAIYSSREPCHFNAWMKNLTLLLEALLRPELRIRARWSLLRGKSAAVWLELPDGGRWMGDKKACQGVGKTFVYKNWWWESHA